MERRHASCSWGTREVPPMKLQSRDANADEWSEASAAPVPSSPWDSSANASGATPATDERSDSDSDDDDDFDDDDIDGGDDDSADEGFLEDDNETKFDEEDYGPAAGRKPWQLSKLDEKYRGEDVDATVNKNGESMRMPADAFN